MTSPPISAAIIVDTGQVLMARRNVSEGKLSWQFPAGAVEPGETPEAAAVREAHEEVGIVVHASERLGERVHPSTRRTMIYIACTLISGSAFVADKEELAEVEWCNRAAVSERVPYPLFEPVQAYLDSELS